MRRGDLTVGDPHYQTGPIGGVNRWQKTKRARQLIAPGFLRPLAIKPAKAGPTGAFDPNWNRHAATSPGGAIAGGLLSAGIRPFDLCTLRWLSAAIE
jgi:hypothetical protein